MKAGTKWILGLLVAAAMVLIGVFHESPFLFHIGTAILVLIGLVVNSFVIIYSRRNWRANPYGRALMYSKLSLAVLVDLSLATVFLGQEWDGRAALRVILFGGVFVAQVRLLQLLFSLRNQQAREDYSASHDNAGREIN